MPTFSLTLDLNVEYGRFSSLEITYYSTPSKLLRTFSSIIMGSDSEFNVLVTFENTIFHDLTD